MSTLAINLRKRHIGRRVTIFTKFGTELGTFRVKHIAGNATIMATNFQGGDMPIWKADRVVLHRS